MNSWWNFLSYFILITEYGRKMFHFVKFVCRFEKSTFSKSFIKILFKNRSIIQFVHSETYFKNEEAAHLSVRCTVFTVQHRLNWVDSVMCSLVFVSSSSRIFYFFLHVTKFSDHLFPIVLVLLGCVCSILLNSVVWFLLFPIHPFTQLHQNLKFLYLKRSDSFYN